MPRFKSTVSLYTRVEGKYKLTDPCTFYGEGTVFCLRLLDHSSIQTRELYARFDADAETARDDIEKIMAAGV